jgi:hypothetical protein
MSEHEFSVWWDDPEGFHHAERRFVSAHEAVECAKSLTQRPAAMLGVIRRVIITDGGDFINFEWQYGRGITFPQGKTADRADGAPVATDTGPQG